MSAASAFSARAGFVDLQVPSLQVRAVQTADSGFSFCLRRHLDESETSGPVAVLVLYHGCRLDLPELFERLAQILVGDLKGQIAYIDVHYFLLFVNNSPNYPESSPTIFRIKDIFTTGDLGKTATITSIRRNMSSANTSSFYSYR
jgi:hypothetical protein